MSAKQARELLLTNWQLQVFFDLDRMCLIPESDQKVNENKTSRPVLGLTDNPIIGADVGMWMIKFVNRYYPLCFETSLPVGKGVMLEILMQRSNVSFHATFLKVSRCYHFLLLLLLLLEELKTSRAAEGAAGITKSSRASSDIVVLLLLTKGVCLSVSNSSPASKSSVVTTTTLKFTT